VRPAAEAFALPVTRHRLEELAGLFDPPAEVVADFREAPNADEAGTTPDDVLTLLRRRPCTAKDVADGLGIRPNEAIKLVDTLTGSGRAVAVRRDTGVFYKALEE